MAVAFSNASQFDPTQGPLSIVGTESYDGMFFADARMEPLEIAHRAMAAGLHLRSSISGVANPHILFPASCARPHDEKSTTDEIPQFAYLPPSGFFLCLHWQNPGTLTESLEKSGSAISL